MGTFSEEEVCCFLVSALVRDAQADENNDCAVIPAAVKYLMNFRRLGVFLLFIVAPSLKNLRFHLKKGVVVGNKPYTIKKQMEIHVCYCSLSLTQHADRGNAVISQKKHSFENPRKATPHGERAENR